MSRPPLPIGTWGNISTRVEKTDAKGKPSPACRRPGSATTTVTCDRSPPSARPRPPPSATYSRSSRTAPRPTSPANSPRCTRLPTSFDLWEKRFEGLVADGKYSPTSLDTYRRAIKNHIRPALGEFRIGEATTPRIDTVLTKIKTTAGAPTAKTCRATISGAMKLTVRYGATSVNPVREVDAIESRPKNPPRSLTGEELTLLRNTSPPTTTPYADLPDLIAFLLGTGVRIGEALAVLWSKVDLEAGTVEVTHTIVRIKGEDLLRKATKSKSRRAPPQPAPPGSFHAPCQARRRHPSRRSDLRRTC